MPRGDIICSKGDDITVTDSHGEFSGGSSHSIFSLIFWSELYDAIRGSMGFDHFDDCLATRVIESLLYDASIEGRYIGLGDICSLIRGKSACIVGASSSLERDIDCVAREVCDVVLAADGALSYLLEYSIIPEIVITDLDGSWEKLVEASNMGSIIVIHAHGDNIASLKYIVPFLDRVHGTTQCILNDSKFSSVVGGFTDGDRAVYMSVYCGARKVYLLGMDWNAKVGRWSKPWLKDHVEAWREKKMKLAIGQGLVSLVSKIVHKEKNSLTIEYYHC